MADRQYSIVAQNKAYSFVLLVLTTLLFWEWLRPIPELTDTHSLGTFLIFFAFVMMLQWLRIPVYISFVLNVLLLFYLMHHLYLYMFGSFFQKEWLLFFIDELKLSFSLLIDQNIEDHSVIVKTFGFMIAMWYIAVSLYKLILIRKQILSIFLMTIIYLAVLDTFTPFDAKYSIIRTIVCGFLLLALLQLERISENQRVSKKQVRRYPFPWILLSLLFVISISYVGFSAPKADPSWSDPLQAIESFSQSVGTGRGSHVVQKSGYGDSDQRLGGDFVSLDTVIFRAISEGEHYWRGESKDYYNGHGWEQTNQIAVLIDTDSIEDAWNHAGRLYEDVETKSIRSYVVYEEDHYDHIFYHGDIRSLQVEPLSRSAILNPDSRRLRMVSDHRSNQGGHRVSQYQLTADDPVFSINELREVDLNQVPQDIMDQYTQLPDTLPTRVSELTHEITAEYENIYDKVKEVETYFLRNNYEYRTDDVPVPDDHQDYVDQFLFETKYGYCDNFSTSMVVMLRTIGIPARWVKGFTFGDIEDRDLENGHTSTVVRAKNAHSWVEVYFPQIGWVPFEPTRTFTSPFEFTMEHDNLDEDSEVSTEESSEEEIEDNEEQQDEFGVNTTDGMSFSDTFKRNLLMSLIIFLFISIILFIYRRKIFLSWAIYCYEQGYDKNKFFHAYERFISYIGRSVSKRKKSQTMREYVRNLETGPETNEVSLLTRLYEELRYGNPKHHKPLLIKAKKIFKQLSIKTRTKRGS